MAKTTFWDVIERTIEKTGTPLSAKEIWDKANELGTIGDFITTGKTPWSTIAAYCWRILSIQRLQGRNFRNSKSSFDNFD